MNGSLTDTMSFQAVQKDQASSIFGISIRSWIAILLVITVCLNQLLVTGVACYYAIVKGDITVLGNLSTIGEPLYSLSIAALGFYFGLSQRMPPGEAAKVV